MSGWRSQNSFQKKKKKKDTHTHKEEYAEDAEVQRKRIMERCTRMRGIRQWLPPYFVVVVIVIVQDNNVRLLDFWLQRRLGFDFGR